MKMMLAENIRTFRKERSLTQEQLAEAVGVTVGTVSKWENGNCTPDISMIMELADFFEISMDVLVGYDTPTKKVPELLERIANHFKKHQMDEAITESSKALVKYPNNFELLMKSARIRFILWYETKYEDYRNQAIALYRKAQQNIPDDEKKNRNEKKILHNLAQLEKSKKKRVKLLEEINFNGMYDAEIGEAYRDDKDLEKAYEYLSEGLYLRSFDVLNVMGRWIGPLIDQKRYDKALDMIAYSELILETIYEEGKRSVGSKMIAHLEIIKAVIYEMLDKHKDMRECVEKAVRLAKFFDEAPVYDLSTGARLWLSKKVDDAPLAFDDLGPSALNAIENILTDFQNEYKGIEKNAADNVREYLKAKKR